MSSQDERYSKSLMELKKNKNQWEFINCDQNCVVLAGPGSGKTKALITKIVKIKNENIHNNKNIACITYSNECVRELRNRCFLLTNCENIYIGTLHSFLMKHIIIPYHELFDSDFPQKLRFVSQKKKKEIIDHVFNANFGYLMLKKYEENKFVQEALIHRRSIIERDSSCWTENEEMVKFIYLYEKVLRENGLIDFDDILISSINALRKFTWLRKIIKSKFPIICIDEYQDLGNAVEEMVNCFLDIGIWVIAVGDPHQSIYGFNGADPNIMFNLASKTGVKRIDFDVNYRSNNDLINAAHRLIEKPTSRQSSYNNESGKIELHKYPNGIQDQLKFIFEHKIPELKKKYNYENADFAVLYVDKNVGDIVSEVAEQYSYSYIRIDNNAPYQKTRFNRWLEEIAYWITVPLGTEHAELETIKNIWTSFLIEEYDSELETRFACSLFKCRNQNYTLNEWLEIIKKDFLDDFLKNINNQFPDEVISFEDLYIASSSELKDYSLDDFAHQINSKECLNICTLHSSKGREFEVVFIPDLEDGRLPWKNATEKVICENRRLLYVGLTRAKKEVHLLYSGYYSKPWGVDVQTNVSRFVRELKL